LVVGKTSIQKHKKRLEKNYGFLLLERALKELHGLVLSALNQENLFKQDQFTTTIEEAVQMLNAHDWDNFKTIPNKVPNYVEGMANIISLAKWKINIASLMIPEWNEPSMCIPKMVSSYFAGVQRVYITANQNTRWVP